MTWEQKWAALSGLSSHAYLTMREPGKWYCYLGDVEISSKSMLRSPTQSGSTPKHAVELCWEQHTDLPDGECVVVNAMREDRRAYRWNGYMWQTITERLHASP